MVKRRCFLAMMPGCGLALTAAPVPAHGETRGFSAAAGGGAQLRGVIRGAGPALVFLHGGASHFQRSFGDLAQDFVSDHTVIGIDQRGHGRSPDNDQPFDYHQMADDTARALTALHAGPCDLVGHSDGANVALLLASRHPQLVRSVLASGPNARGDFLGLLDWLRRRVTPVSRFAAGFSAAEREDYARVSPDGAAHWMTFMAKTQALWNTLHVLDPQELAGIHAPVMVMVGERDIIPASHARAIVQALPHGELRVLSGAGHLTMKDQPGPFRAVVRDFLQGAAPR